MMRLSKDDIAARAEALISQISSPPKGTASLRAELIDGESVIGGGAAPTAVLATRVIALTHRSLSADELSVRLREAHPPVIARVDDGRVLLDLRTVFAEQDAQIAEALNSLG